jgi:hypothetical protein
MLLNIRTRFIFIFSLFAIGAVGLLLSLPIAIFVLAWTMATFLLLGFFLFGTVNAALFALKNGKVDKADQHLKSVYKENWLMKSHRAYFHFASGLVALYKSRSANEQAQVFLDAGEDHLLKSLDLGMRRKAERAMAYLNLAHIAYSRGDKAKTQEYTDKTKENQTTDLHLKKGIEDLEAAIEKMP